MRIHHNPLQLLCQLSLLIFFTFSFGLSSAQNKTERKARTISISLKVVDDSGNPIPGAKVIAGEGMINVKTDANGAVLLDAYPNDYVTISVTGFEKNISLVQELIKSNTVKLFKSKLFMTSDDDVALPFGTMKRRNITGSATVLTADQLEKYPSTDLRNAFSGLVNGMEVVEKNGSPGFSSEELNGLYRITQKVGISSRGAGMRYIVDNMPIDITEMPLDPGEIESVSIIKDVVEKAKFGPYGADGIIFIKTKRGEINERNLKVNLEDGVNIIGRMPGWTNGADYASLNNQARVASGLNLKYSPDDIAAYAKNDPYDLYHPSVNFSDLMLKDTRAFRRVNISSNGGNDNVQYAAYFGYNGEGDIYKMGSISDYNRLTARSNFDIKLNDVISVQFDIEGALTIRRSPNYGYTSTVGEGGTQMDLLELNSALPDITDIPPVAFPVYANIDQTTGLKWYGVSNTYKYNPVGNLNDNGYYTETGRLANTNFVLNYDFGNIIKGLKSKTGFIYNVNNVLRLGKALDYIAYIATPSVSAKTGNDTILLAKSHDGVSSSTLADLHDYYTQRFLAYETLGYERSSDIHSIHTNLTYMLSRLVRNGFTEPQRMQNLMWSGGYTYNDKISIEAVLNYAGTSSFDKGKRFAMFPSVGMSWILSDESFLSGLKFIDYLKLRAEAGILGSDNFTSPFLYRDNWSSGTGANFGPYSLNQWFGSTTVAPYTASKQRTGNPDLTWEKRKEISVGIDALMFKHKLSLELNYYNRLLDGQITQLYNLPYMAGFSSVLPYFNYNKTRYFGLETGLQFTDHSGKLGYSFGGSFTIQNSKYVKYAESAYRSDYQFRTGLPVDTYWGQTYLGKFQTDAEALVVPQLYDVVLHQGDLKYSDTNGDGFIDDNDMHAIGHTTPRLFYSVNANVSYRNFEITFVGTGRAFYDIPMTNKYFWNGWGDNNYSDFVRDNVGGAYPNLTYYKVNNNFVPSDFWLEKGGFFKIQNIELAYNLPGNLLKLFRSRGIRIYARGANLLTITKVKDIDPESINSGVTEYPLYKTFSGGIKLTF